MNNKPCNYLRKKHQYVYKAAIIIKFHLCFVLNLLCNKDKQRKMRLMISKCLTIKQS